MGAGFCTLFMIYFSLRVRMSSRMIYVFLGQGLMSNLEMIIGGSKTLIITGINYHIYYTLIAKNGVHRDPRVEPSYHAQPALREAKGCLQDLHLPPSQPAKHRGHRSREEHPVVQTLLFHRDSFRTRAVCFQLLLWDI